MSEKVLVIGATGNVGTTLVQLLTESGQAVKAATRQPQSYPARAQVEAVQFEYDDAATYAPALEGADRVFLLAKSADPEPQSTLNPFIDAAAKAGVRHLVLMTAKGVEQAEEAGLRKVERHLMASGMAYTILRPSWFMQNFYPGFLYPAIKGQQGIFLPAGDGKSGFIDTRDIAAVATKALTENGRHSGKEYALTGPQALSYQETAEILSQVSGRELKYVAISDDDMRRALRKEGWPDGPIEFMVNLFSIVRQGWAAETTADVETVLGREALSFEQFAKDFAPAWNA